MENKKINVAHLNTAKKNNSTSITLNPELAKMILGGLLKSNGVNVKEIEKTINVMDSKIQHIKDNKKETTQDIDIEIKTDKKDSNENKEINSNKSSDSTKLV